MIISTLSLSLHIEGRLIKLFLYIGIVITISGGVLYSYVEMVGKKNGQGGSQSAKMEEGRAGGNSWSR